MKPYFESENGKLYHGKWQDFTDLFKGINLILSDPPYGHTINAYERPQLKYRGMMGTKTDFGDISWNKLPTKRDFKLLLELISGNHIYFGANYFSSFLPNSGCWLVWDKDNGDTNFADCELAWTSFTDKAIRKIKYRWNGMLQECGGKFKEKRYHPTQKPVGLFMQILKKYAQPNWTVLDPFAGSRTTGLACERLSEMNLKYVLIEREEKYCAIIKNRIEQETQQLKLF